MDAITMSLDLNRRYETQWQRLSSSVQGLEGEYIQTTLGPVWLTCAGPKDAPPLLLLHGLHTPAPFSIEFFRSLTEHFRVLCPDIPGQAGKTPGLAPMPSNQAYALWIECLLDKLGISSCCAIGLSFGGAVLLDLAVRNPERISAASLVVPAGFFRPIFRPLKKLLMPFVDFKLHSDQMHFDQLMKPLLGNNWPALEDYYFAVFQAGIPLTLVPPGPYDSRELKRFAAPVQLITATEDLYFSSAKLRKCARQLIPNLVQLSEVEDLHVPSPLNRDKIQNEVLSFLMKEMSM